MVAITMFSVFFFIHAILLQPANSLVLLKEVDEAPFETLCSTTCQDVGNTEDGRYSPFYKCSCSPSCVTYGDCCYDSPYRKETTWERINSICVTIFGRGQYRVISGCPADKPSYFCYDSIGHLPIVTSKTTNTTYANIFCATCNGDGDRVINWNVMLRCSSDEKDDVEVAADESTVLIYQSNQIWRMSESTTTKSLCMFHVHYDNFSVIDRLELRPCDNEKKISECSSSWTDAGILKLCRSYEDPVYFDSKLFRNSHCAQCNYLDRAFARCMPFSIEVMQQMGLVDPNLPQFCQKRGSKACMDYLTAAVGGKGRPYPFANILNIHQEACIPEPGERCCPGEKFDFKFSKMCRKISGK